MILRFWGWFMAEKMALGAPTRWRARHSLASTLSRAFSVITKKGWLSESKASDYKVTKWSHSSNYWPSPPSNREMWGRTSRNCSELPRIGPFPNRWRLRRPDIRDFKVPPTWTDRSHLQSQVPQDSKYACIYIYIIYIYNMHTIDDFPNIWIFFWLKRNHVLAAKALKKPVS